MRIDEKRNILYHTVYTFMRFFPTQTNLEAYVLATKAEHSYRFVCAISRDTAKRIFLSIQRHREKNYECTKV